jgi:hypothetical protein
MPLTLQELGDAANIFAEIDRDYGTSGGGHRRTWTAADLTYNQPKRDWLNTVQYAIPDPFTVKLGKAETFVIEVQVWGKVHGRWQAG